MKDGNKASWVMVSKPNGLPLICTNNYKEIQKLLGLKRVQAVRQYLCKARKSKNNIAHGWEFTFIKD